MRFYWSNTFKAIIFILLGFLGMALFSICQHLYQDHKNLHAVFQIIEQAQKANQTNLPAGGK